MNPKHTTQPARSKSARHYGKAGKNAPVLYRVTFRYAQTGERFIEAMSPEEIREKVKRIPAMDGFWQDGADSYEVREIVPATEQERPKDAEILRIDL